MKEYKCIDKQIFKNDRYEIVPLRFEDRFKIMSWRNEQIYHLRQSELLTEEKQDWYFKEVVTPLFGERYPKQLLFSFLEDKECIGYGGLVHINWKDKFAEISFIMKTQLEESHFSQHWKTFLSLIEELAFKELKLNKIFTYAFDLRPHLYPVLENQNFQKEARLKKHIYYQDQYHDVLIHSKWNKRIELRPATFEDVEITFKWVNDPKVREFSFNQGSVNLEEHKKWFSKKIESKNCLYFIAQFGSSKIGSFRLDVNEKEGLISFLIDPKYHGIGLGREILQKGIEKAFEYKREFRLIGLVQSNNIASSKIFRKLNFVKEEEKNNILKYSLEYG